MDYQESILGMLDLVDQEEDCIETNLSESERERCGELKSWAPKEILCHCANWTGRQIDNLRRVREGGKFVAYDNYLELNDMEFLDDCRLSWRESVARSKKTRQELREWIKEMTEAEFETDPREVVDNLRPNWQYIIFTSVDHPMIHLGEILGKAGFGEAAGKFQQDIARMQLKVAEGDDTFHGRILYNLACGQALNGESANAIENLKLAFPLYPGLVEWSKQDTDLDSLRELPEFKALYS